MNGAMMRQKKVAIITGGGRGISLGLAVDGLGIAIVYNKHPDDALSVVNELQAIGCQVSAYQADVASRD
jgi:NAD(P)-dependent dehydrogenase (short-subunit alcohol dehydrogenase family)